MNCGAGTTIRPGLALIEAVLASMVVGLMFVAALRLVVASRAGEADIEHRTIAAHLASELLSEIMSLPYADPNEPPVFGPEPSEHGAAARAAFDDVDDYHGWIESPPQERSGGARAHLAGWSRTVDVHFVTPGDPSVASPVDRGVKRITVTVRRAGIPMSRMSALRTSAVPR
jgi:hypothetical protein